MECSCFLIRVLSLLFLGNLPISKASIDVAPRFGSTPQNGVVNPVREVSTWEWCDCGKGLARVVVWSANDETENITVKLGAGDPQWLVWRTPTSKIFWLCDGMHDIQTTTIKEPLSQWSLQFFTRNKPLFCDRMSGRLRFVAWRRASYKTSVPFSSGEAGYFCIKIPSVIKTHNGTLLAFAEARNETCSDFAATSIVLKRSEDGGATWSGLQVVRSDSKKGINTVIGNAAPVQLATNSSRHPGRILVPHSRNNSDVWFVYSDDDGRTWSTPRFLPGMSSWKWVALGPPASLQLSSGRVFVPGYHGDIRGNLINNLVHGHAMISDDDGDTWELVSAHGLGPTPDNDHFLNENQAVQLSNGSVLVNARSFASLPFLDQWRVQALSNDGGVTFGPARFAKDLPQPFNGCQGSIITVAQGLHQFLLFSGPNSFGLRKSMTLWTSVDSGETWQVFFEVDPGMSGYSSLQVDCDNNDCEALLLYEQSDTDQIVMDPDRFVFRRIPLSKVRLQASMNPARAEDGYGAQPMHPSLSFVI
eukprot:TRINITY_DN13575_c0_g1_i1.p1 TRINITY_DN13575_c0_g1~~TRINITY_DN13575_c0_g1_i1.p1  ORF type:complete len:531 (+),score=64.78 TRINITY_DN13575_c0_g1_i1:49-1641(+)